jgi:hypothetical protein
MKTKQGKARSLKVMTLGIGLTIGFLAMSFLIPFYSQSIEKNREPDSKNIEVPQHPPAYTEVRGMN